MNCIIMEYLVWNGGVRKQYKNKLSDIKRNYKNRNSSIQKRYDLAEANIEKNYKRGQLLSKKDSAREIAADNKARKDWSKSKAIYNDDKRKAKIQYKSNLEKVKTDYKTNYKKLKRDDSAADKLLFNKATRKKAAQYMTENKMSMTEARKKAHKEAIRNTAITLGVIGSYSVYELAKRKLVK